MRFLKQFLLAVLSGCVLAPLQAAAPTGPEALLVILGDQHSAYERSAQLVATVDRLKAEYPALPLAILLNGDTLEHGNVVARRSAGAIDFALFAALARRAPTILNLGNHEPEFYDVAETVRRIQATGVTVVGNIVNRATGELYALASTSLTLGREEATVVGFTTDHLSTYRAAVRPSLDLANPVVWAKEKLPALLGAACLPVVLSHAGLTADREILPLLPPGTLFAGAHDHLRFVHALERGAYVHSGSWNEWVTLAWLHHNAAGEAVWQVKQITVPLDGPVDPELAGLIRETQLKYLTPDDTATVGRSPRAMPPAEAAKFVAGLMASSAGVDAAFIGNTTFGAGLPAGATSRVEFDACVRFDGTLFTADVDGTRLQALLAAANQGPDVAFEKRRGEFLFAVGPSQIDPAKRYRIATTDWGARNTRSYFGDPAIEWQELGGAKLKTRVLAGMKSVQP